MGALARSSEESSFAEYGRAETARLSSRAPCPWNAEHEWAFAPFSFVSRLPCSVVPMPNWPLLLERDSAKYGGVVRDKYLGASGISRRRRRRVKRPPADSVRVWRVEGLPGVELLEATVDRHVYARHAHDVLAIGTMCAGEAEFWCHGATHRAGKGSLLLFAPGETHDGGRASGAGAPDIPARHRMVYIEPSGLDEYLGDAGSASATEMCFRDAAPRSPTLVAIVRRFHFACERPAALLRRQELLGELLRAVIAGHAAEYAAHRAAVGSPGSPAALSAHRGVARAREFLEENVGQDVALSTLADLAGLHPVYLVRVFRRHVGLPPHAYQLHVRLSIARRRLAAGEPVATIAHSLGFSDQSHFTKHFKRAFGLPPARYRADVVVARR